MRSFVVQPGNAELTEELAALSLAEVSARCTDILRTQTIPVERLNVLLDNMTRFRMRADLWSADYRLKVMSS